MSLPIWTPMTAGFTTKTISLFPFPFGQGQTVEPFAEITMIVDQNLGNAEPAAAARYRFIQSD